MKNIARISMLLAAAFCSAARRREVRPAGAREPALSTSAGSRRPDACTGRARARRFRLLPVLALLLAAFSPFAAAPAAAAVLVSNVGQTAGGNNGSFFSSHAQAFTTGSNTGGYTLTSIEVHLHGTYTAQELAGLTAELWSASGGNPSMKVADLTTPSSLSGGIATYTAPSSTTLTASTAYFVVLYSPSAGFGDRPSTTTSDNEDSGAATGWSIADTSLVASNTLNPVGATWGTRTTSLLIRVNGSAVQTSSTPVWSATLTPQTLSATAIGCSNARSGSSQKCSTAATLSDDGPFTIGGTSYSIEQIWKSSASSSSNLTLSAAGNSDLAALKFCVGSTAYALTLINGFTNGQWSSEFAFTVGTAVTVSIGTSCAQQVTRSTNANLSGLTAGSSTSSTGQYTDFSIGTFGATTTTYTASVANDQTHVKLTPTVADTGKATVGVRKGNAGSFTPVTSGSASSAIALDVGANTLVVRVTAEDTTTTKDYTVTVTRRAAQTLSTNANLSGLTAGSATSSTGTFTNFSIGTFGATTTSYTASVANDRTHVKLTPTVADTGKATVTVAGNTVTSGQASGPIALSVGANAITVRVTAEDTTTTKDYTVTVTRQALPAKVTTAVLGTMTVGDGGKWKGFRATPSVGQFTPTDFKYGGVGFRILGLRLTNIGGFLLFHLDKALDRKWGLVLNVGDSRFRIADAVLSTGPGYEGVIASWAYSNQGETPPSWTVGQSVPVSLGTLTSSTVKLSVSPNPVNEGASASVEACLSAVPQGTARIPVTLSHGTSANRSEDGDWGVSLSGDTDGRLPISTAYSIAISGWLQTSCGVVNIPTHPDSDADDETFTVALDTASLPPGVRAGSPASVVVRIKDLTDLPEVTLRAVRETVAEGSPVELQVALTEPLANDVEIPLRVRFVTSETADHGFIRSITIAAGATSGTGTIRTHEDDDTDDERFQVAVIQPDLPSGVAPGRPSTVGITIADGANARLRALDLNTGN